MTRILRILAPAALILTVPAVHAQSADNGKKAFVACAACHSIDGTNGLGPSMKGVVGRKIASAPGFRYSAPMKRKAGTWTAEEIDKYLANPQAAVPGNAMAYSGLADAKERADLVAYLGTLN